MLEEEKTPAPRLDERTMQQADEFGPVNTPLQEVPGAERGKFEDGRDAVLCGFVHGTRLKLK